MKSCQDCLYWEQKAEEEPCEECLINRHTTGNSLWWVPRNTLLITDEQKLCK